MVRDIHRVKWADVPAEEFRYARDPMIITDLPSHILPSHPAFSSLESLRAISSDDIVGFVPAGESEAVEMSLTAAIEKLATTGGYINGWEYVAGDNGSDLSSLTAGIDGIVNEFSLLPKLGMHGQRLDSVMKWIFVSNGPSTGSAWHADPIGTNAWMVVLHGTKEWSVRTTPSAGDELTGYLSSGELIIIPSGMEHKVDNIGDGLTVAVSHNWVSVDGGSEANMYHTLVDGLCLLRDFITGHPVSGKPLDFYLEAFQAQSKVDNILFGLMMLFIHLDPAIRDRYIEGALSIDHEQLDRLFTFLTRLV